jgi:hypothetical protein
MSESNIKFVVVGRPSDQKILGAEAPESIKKALKLEVISFKFNCHLPMDSMWKMLNK